MLLDRDQFLVTYDPAKADAALLIATIKEAGYTAQVVSSGAKKSASPLDTLPQGSPLLDDALARAKIENKPIVLDFSAEWCAPCKRMEKTTFADPGVAALLQRCVLVRIDTDHHAGLSRQLGVIGLPDIRLVTPDGRIIRQLRGFQNVETFTVELEQLIRKVPGR